MNGVASGIKKSGNLDLGIIYSAIPAVAAGVFTKNSIKAAPLIVSQRHLRNNICQAIVVNSGNANCFTGKFGQLYAEQTAEIFGFLLNIPKKDVLLASTGIIGKPLPFLRIRKAAADLTHGLSPNKSHKFAGSILTTDKRTKEIAVRFKLDNKNVTIGACAKGSGMIAPNMATMLAFINTDANISAPMLKLALNKAVDITFNRISVDACMSTNDMVTVMANSLAKNKIINSKGRNFNIFFEALHYVCLDLAKKIVLDGEGASKFIEIFVDGAANDKQAKNIGLTIANSNLVKTAAFGNNPNWGRVAAAVGSLGLKKITENNLKIDFSPFTNKEIKITVELNLGKAQTTVYTSDLSYDYVRINGEYN